jgi:hypothetical protein
MTFSLAAFRIIAVSMATCFCSGVFAQSWEKEPDSFMGIKFGESLTAQLPECPIDKKFSSENVVVYDIYVKTRCFMKQGPWAQLLNPPDIGIPVVDFSIKLLNGVVEGVDFIYPHAFYSAIYELSGLATANLTILGQVVIKPEEGWSLRANPIRGRARTSLSA